MRDVNFYREVFGNLVNLSTIEKSEDILQIFDVKQISPYEEKILRKGGQLTIPLTVLKENKKVAYYSDPDGNMFALLQAMND